MNILLVCAGNTCRSPMAAGLMTQLLLERTNRHDIRSAGLSPGRSVAEKAVQVMKDVGICIAGHSPQRLTEDLIAWADVIVPMERPLGQGLLERHPSARSKVRYLDRDIKDPMIEDTLPAYRRARDELRQALEALVRELAT